MHLSIMRISAVVGTRDGADARAATQVRAPKEARTRRRPLRPDRWHALNTRCVASLVWLYSKKFSLSIKYILFTKLKIKIKTNLHDEF